MSSEFGQIEQKITEYEIARNEAGQINVQEKVEQIKRNLKAKLILDFVKINEAIHRAPNDGPIDKWDELEKLGNLFTEQVDPIFNFSGLTQAIARHESASEFFWPEQGPLVDRLTEDTIVQCLKLHERTQRGDLLNRFDSYILFPPIADEEIGGMVESIQKQYKLTFKIVAELSKSPRPDFVYPLAFPDLEIYGQMLVDGQSIDQIIEKTMPSQNLNGLNFQEYLFWLVCLSKIYHGAGVDRLMVNKVPKLLFDERRKVEGGKFEVGRVVLMKDNFATLTSTALGVRNPEVLIALNGWEDRDV